MGILIKNTTAITLQDDQVLRGVDLAIEGRTIRSIGPVPADFAANEVIDGREHVALPAFFNAHCHAPMTLERGWAEDLPFDRWLNEKIWTGESALQEEDVYWGAALAACEMIRAGVVAFADHYFWEHQTARVVEQAGMKALLGWCQFGIGAEHEVGGAVLEDTIAFIREWHGAADGRVRCALAPHSPYMCPDPFLRRVVDASHALGVGIHLHVSESQEQVENSLRQHGASPVAHLAGLGVFDGHAIAAHCNVVSDEDIAILAHKGVHVGHTPKTYMKLALPMPPLQRQLDGGVDVALATDGPASNSDFNMLEIMRLTGLYQKLHQLDPEAMPRLRLLQLATQAGARALGFPESGVLREGAPADLILIDLRRPHFFPRHDLLAGIVYTAHPGDVSHVVVDGRLLLRDGALLTLDEERIRYEAERRAFRMVGTPMSQVREYRA